MKKLALVITLFVLTTTLLQAGALQNFTGHWMNQDKNTRGLTKLHISLVGRSLQVQAWGKAHPHDSDLGKVIATAYTPSVSTKAEQNTRALLAEYTNSFSHRMLVIRQRGTKHLLVEEFVRFTDHSNRSAYNNSYTFKNQVFPFFPTIHQPGIRPIPVNPTLGVERPDHIRPGFQVPRPTLSPGILNSQFFKEDKIKFNWKDLRIRKIDNSWKIVEGTSHYMMDFGSSLREASQALGIIQRYRMNEMCFVGRPDPSMTYFLVNGQAPQGAMAKEDAIKFDPANIEVRKVNNRWKIMEGASHMMMDFGANEMEARKALHLIKQHEFTHMCFVGRPNPSMTYFRK